MNEEPVPPSLVKVNRDKKTFSILLLLVLFVMAALYCIYMWKQNSDLQASLESEKTRSQALAEENDHLKSVKANPDTNQTTVSQTIGGKKITYALTEKTERILLWQNPDGSTGVSHKDVLSYVTKLPASVRQDICGSMGTHVTTNDIAMGTLDAKKATYGDNPGANCLQAMATDRNTNVSLRAEAAALETATTQSIESFVAGMSVQ